MSDSFNNSCCSGTYCRCPWIIDKTAFHKCCDCKKWFHGLCLGSEIESSTKKCAMCIIPQGLSEEACKMIVMPQPEDWTGQGGYDPNNTSTISKPNSPSNERHSVLSRKANAKAKAKSRKSSGQIANQSVLAGPDIYFDRSKAACNHSGKLGGKVTKCKPSIVIKWDPSMTTDKSEKVNKQFLRTSFPPSMKDVILKIVVPNKRRKQVL